MSHPTGPFAATANVRLPAWDAEIPSFASGLPSERRCNPSFCPNSASSISSVRRFSLHPLQTFTHDRGPEQLDGSWAAVTGETDEAIAVANELALVLGLLPFPLADRSRALYHAGAVVASNYLVTLHEAAAGLVAAAGAPPEALEPLMRRTIENGFELTGPIARGDLETVRAHEDAIDASEPELGQLYRVLADATRALA